MLRALKSFLSIAALTTCAWGQSDYHLAQDANRQIYIDSAFAHGHRHGYEEGFHAGDEDYHFRRTGSLLQKSRHTKGYQSSFGDKKSYSAGYENGFRAGYADSYAGRVFHPAESAVFVTTSLPIGAVPAKDSAHDFDRGVMQGYLAGYSNSDNISDEPGIAESASWRCSQESHAGSYCNGFGAGYVMGRTDSRSVALMQKSQPSTLARNSR